MKLKTKKIVDGSDRGFKIINSDDFNPDIHKELEEKTETCPFIEASKILKVKVEEAKELIGDFKLEIKQDGKLNAKSIKYLESLKS